MNGKEIDRDDIKKASTYYLIGTFFNKGMSFLTVPIFTRLLSTYDYGIVNTYTSWSGIISVVFGFAIYMGIRAAFIDHEDVIDDFMSVCNTFTIISSLVISITILILIHIFAIDISIYLIILCLLEGLADAVLQNYIMYLMMRYKYKARTYLMVLPNLSAMMISVILILIFFHDNRFWARIIPGSIVKSLFAIIALIICYSKSHRLYDKQYLKYALNISVPLVFHGVALGVLSQSDRTMITWLADASQTGIYSLIYNFSMIATVVTNALEGVWIPWFITRLKIGKYGDIGHAMSRYSFLICTLICCIMLVGPEVVKVMASEKYWSGIKVIPPLVVSNYIIFLYTLFVNVEHYHKKTIFISVNTIIAAIINISLNYFFIPRYGYVAAAYTTLISYCVSLLLHISYSKKLEPKVGRIRDHALPILLTILSVMLFYMCLEEWYIRWMAGAGIFLLLIFSERDLVFQIVKKKKPDERR